MSLREEGKVSLSFFTGGGWNPERSAHLAKVTQLGCRKTSPFAHPFWLTDVRRYQRQPKGWLMSGVLLRSQNEGFLTQSLFQDPAASPQSLIKMKMKCSSRRVMLHGSHCAKDPDGASDVANSSPASALAAASSGSLIIIPLVIKTTDVIIKRLLIKSQITEA